MNYDDNFLKLHVDWSFQTETNFLNDIFGTNQLKCKQRGGDPLEYEYGILSLKTLKKVQSFDLCFWNIRLGRGKGKKLKKQI